MAHPATYRIRAGLLAALWLAASLAPLPSRAETDERQYKLEAVFLYNFFNYITWPGLGTPGDLSSATICIYGNDPLTPYLHYVQEKMTGERKLTIRELHAGQSSAGCNLLFDRTGSPVRSAEGQTPTLTVSDEAHYLQHGGMIALSRDGDRMAMDINNTLLTQQGFQVSSRLLKLAQEVR